MKYKGRQLTGPRSKVIPIIRTAEEGGNIFFIAKGIVDMEPFYSLCPAPTPPVVMLPGGKKQDNVESPVYKDQLNRWWKKRSAWTAITSLRDSPDLEWERVKLDNPDTWEEWQKELQEAGFVDGEFSRILNGIMEVNGLNEGLVEEARQSFLTIQASRENGQSLPMAEAENTQSGEPASSLESVPQDLKE